MLNLGCTGSAWGSLSSFRLGMMTNVFLKPQLAASKSFCFLVLFFGLAIHSAAETQDPRDGEESNSGKVDNLVQAVMKQEHVPGLALAVVKDGKIVKMQAYGLTDAEQRYQPRRTPFSGLRPSVSNSWPPRS